MNEFTDLIVTEKLNNGCLRYKILDGSKVRFGTRPVISDFTEEELRDAFEFAFRQGFNLNQKANWAGAPDDEKRPPFQMFMDTLSGKTGEIADVHYFNIHDLPNRGVDYSITGIKEGDMGDIFVTINGLEHLIGSRTTNHYSNLLLLETSKDFSSCSATILNRIKYTLKGSRENTLEKLIPSHLRNINLTGEGQKEGLYEFIKTLSIEVELTGKMFKADYLKLDKRGHVLRRGDYFMYTFIKTENRYVCSGDLDEIMIKTNNEVK